MNSRKSLALLLVLILPAVSSCVFLPKEDPVPPPPLIYSYESAQYQLVTVARGNVDLFTDVSATYVPARQETLSFRLTGLLIKSIDVGVGDAVTKGQILAELDRDDILAMIAQTRHDLDMLELSMRQLGEDEALAQKLARATGAEDDGSFGARREDLQSRIDITRLDLENLENQSAKRVITAGIDGVVTSAHEYADGEYSKEGVSIVTVSDKSLSVFRVYGDDAQYFKEGDAETITAGGTDYTGAVVSAESLGAEPDGKTAYIRLDDASAGAVSSYGTIRVYLDRRTDALYLPKEAVKKANDQEYVYMLDGNGVRVQRNVTTGLAGNTAVEITGGLKEGDAVIAG
ncbi:MAG: efflux RND transporter periplasmic adaptor subunit [Firmicutes bacterium]|nr:efflux RND transporter periplasmic adaptor subunit [Bacillota bacterium]